MVRVLGNADQLVGHPPGREDVSTAGQVSDFGECTALGRVGANPVAVIGDACRLGRPPSGRCGCCGAGQQPIGAMTH
jgi:hypothetical protein